MAAGDVSHTRNRWVSGTRIKAVAVREQAGLAASNARDVGKFTVDAWVGEVDEGTRTSPVHCRGVYSRITGER